MTGLQQIERKNDLQTNVQKEFNQNRNANKLMPFAIGGVSGMISTTIIQPIDMIKVQLQIRSEALGKDAKLNPFFLAREIVKERGIGYLYHGLGSALVRQMTYTTVRMGVYKSLYNDYTKKHGNVNITMKSLFGLTAGFIGILFGNPADLILIRMQADASMPIEQRRNYTGFLNAMSRIVKERGILTLWRGSSPNILRAMVLNLAMLGPFDEVKERLNNISEKKDTLSIRLTASAIAGFLAAFCSLPFDNVKTKLQKMKYCVKTNLFPYTSIMDCFMKSIKNEGFIRLWVGFPTFYVRIAPHAMLTLMIQEILTDTLIKKQSK